MPDSLVVHSTVQDTTVKSISTTADELMSQANTPMCRPSPGRLPQVLGGVSDPCCESLSYVVSSYPCEGIPCPLAVSSRSLAQRSETSSFSHVDH
jgi:hypothetical protein